MIKVSDIYEVKKSKNLAPGSQGKILMEILTGIYLCGNKSNSTIIVAENLEPMEVAA